MAIGPIAAFAALGLQAGGQVLGGIANANSAHYQAQVADNNATIAKQNANYAASAAAAQTERAGLKARAQFGAVRSGIAASGIDVNSGSAADTQVSQREIGNLDTQTVANNAALKVYGYQTQATNFTAQSGLDESQVGPDIIAGITSAAGSAASHAELFSSGSTSPSAISGAPSVPPDYAWMQNGTGPVDDGG